MFVGITHAGTNQPPSYCTETRCRPVKTPVWPSSNVTALPRNERHRAPPRISSVTCELVPELWDVSTPTNANWQSRKASSHIQAADSCKTLQPRPTLPNLQSKSHFFLGGGGGGGGVPNIGVPCLGLPLRGFYSIWGVKGVPLFWEMPMSSRQS